MAPTVPLPRARPSLALVLDGAERIVVLALFAWLLARLGSSYLEHGRPLTLMLIGSESLVVLFILIRRRTERVTRRPADWALAFGATCVPLLVQPSEAAPLAALPGFLLMVAGTGVQLHAKLTLGRSFGLVAADRGVKTHGPYRWVRHPMYAGYLVTHVGFLLISPSAWNVAIYACGFALQLARIGAEERLLSQESAYAALREKVPWRLIPGVC